MIAALVVLALLSGWELYTHVSDIDEFILPAPSAIAQALHDDRALILEDFVVTATEMVLGLGLALVLALGFAVALHFSALLRRALMPLFIGSQAIPVPIVAPLLVAWFGFGLAPKLTIVALVCFFPIIVPTLDALQRVDDDLRRMLLSFGATRWRIFRLVEAPAALPGLITGAKLSVAVATIAAILAEQSGSEEGIGHLITQAIPNFETARAYAGVIVLSAFAVALFGALTLAERRLRPGRRPDARGSGP